MDEAIFAINQLLLETFNDILTIEENALREGSFNNVTITEVHTMEAIGMYGEKTMTQLANDLDITMGTLTVAINNLVKKEYVQKVKSQADKRVFYISLAKKGRLIYRVHEKFHKDMVKATIHGMSDEEVKVLTSALTHLNEFLKEKYYLSKGEK